jgi:hypothetical protein
VLLRKFELLP